MLQEMTLDLNWQEAVIRKDKEEKEEKGKE